MRQDGTPRAVLPGDPDWPAGWEVLPAPAESVLQSHNWIGVGFAGGAVWGAWGVAEAHTPLAPQNIATQVRGVSEIVAVCRAWIPAVEGRALLERVVGVHVAHRRRHRDGYLADAVPGPHDDGRTVYEVVHSGGRQVLGIGPAPASLQMALEVRRRRLDCLLAFDPQP